MPPDSRQTPITEVASPAAATGVALVSGLSSSLFLAQGRFAAGGVLLLLSVLALRWPRSIWLATADAEPAPRHGALALLAVCGVALFFRTYQLEPPGIWGDDAINGLLALDVLNHKITSPFQLVAHAKSIFHALTNYMIAAAFWLFGADPVTLRLPGIVASLVTVPLLYGTVAPLFGARVAVIAALFFASSPLQLNHAKVLLQVVLGEFFLLLGMCALVRGMTGARRWLIPAAGAPLALCLYTYHSAKIAPLVAVIFVGAMLWKTERDRRRLSIECAGLFLVFLLCALPAAQSYLHNPAALTGRAGSVALWPALRASGRLWPLWDALWRTALIFHYQQGPVYHWVGIGWDPALNAVVAFLVVHGIVESLRAWREPRHLLLLGWVVIGMIPGVLSTEAPRIYRIFLASPALYVWAALPLVQLYRAAQAASARRWLRGAVALLVLAVPLIDFNYYFYHVYTHREFRWFQAARLVEMARTLKALGTGWTGYVLSDSFGAGYETLAFLSRAWGLSFLDVKSLADVLPVHDEPDGGVLFILDRGNPAAAAVMRSFYPTVDIDVRTDPPLRTWWFDRWLPLAPALPALPTVAFFPVPRRTADSIRGITVTFLAADGSPIGTRIDTHLAIEERADLGVAAAQVKWSGALYAPVDGTYAFAMEAAGQARLWLDGAQAVSQHTPQVTVPLAEGLHRLTAEATVSDVPILRLKWQPPGKALGVIPPALLFRSDAVHGLLAEYQINRRTLRRIEPYPYYAFFPATFTQPFTAQWRGHLRVPAPGGYRIEVLSNAHCTTTVNGRSLDTRELLAAGNYEFAMQIAAVRGSARLQLFWAHDTLGREPIPPDAFTPP